LSLELLRQVCNLVLTISMIYCVYQAYISLHMFGRARPLLPPMNETHRFAVIICAMNEASVITNLLKSLEQQDYPADAFDVFVTADNCTDETAELSRRAGATVYERFDDVHRSKGFALNWTFSRFLKQYGGRYDACVVFDADNVADKGFLAAMNRQLNAGNRIAAGFRMGKNPSSSWVAGCSSIFWLMQTRFCFVPRAKLGLPCFSVGGTGFMFDLSVLGEGGWQTSSICEDIEFTLNSIASGYFVAFAPDAVFYDEQPLTLMYSIRQRYRWSLGCIQILSLSLPKLFSALFSGRGRVFDAILYCFGIVIAGTSEICGCVLVVLSAAATRDYMSIVTAGIASALGGYVTVVLAACLTLYLEKRSWSGAWKAVLTYPVYLLTWGIINVVVLFYRNPKWKVIPHTESMSIEEIENDAVK